MEIDCELQYEYGADEFAAHFPNLESLTIFICSFEVTNSSFTTLLSELKQLKK
jgi:hypothetical protein